MDSLINRVLYGAAEYESPEDYEQERRERAATNRVLLAIVTVFVVLLAVVMMQIARVGYRQAEIDSRLGPELRLPMQKAHTNNYSQQEVRR